MTLYKQLVIGMSAVFLLLITTVFVVEFNSTRQYLEKQQQSEINNSINTIGLALAPYLEKKDKVAAESVINALFDGSTYSIVRLIFLDNEDEILRSYPIAAPDVPSWFINLKLFDRLHDKRVITSGWMQLAEIEIISDPSHAYSQLWNTLTALVSTFALVFLAGILIALLVIKRALKPLDSIKRKMERIAKGEFGSPIPAPKTVDLLPLVNGINTMTRQVEQSFISQAKEAEQLRQQAYMDPISQLGNRTFFLSQLERWLSESAQGGIFILQAPHIQEAYQELGYEEADKTVLELAQQLVLATENQDSILARITSDEFAIIVPNVDEGELKNLASSVINYIGDLNPDPLSTAQKQINLGVVFNRQQRKPSEIMARLDNALTASTSNPQSPYEYISDESTDTNYGKQQWKQIVEEAISLNNVNFRFQAANSRHGEVFHKEVFSSIIHEGKRYSAAQFLFALDQLKSGHTFDRFVVDHMINELKAKQIDHAVAINITQSAILEPSFIRWLTKVLGQNRGITNQLHFELPENAFVHHPHHTALICHAIRSNGAEFGVDNYGRNFHSLDYIKEFRPNYVKLDYLYTHQLDSEKQQFTLTSISRTANNLGIKTIASRVETQTQLDFLSEHFVEVFQGFIVDK
jgi:EAL domain-containing protein (putative c-di-GMP-specific phosphodiesterase class I)/methyl-accepting chemotaxis protein